MLAEFLSLHRQELIDHCRERVARRFAPREIPARVSHGVPLLLQQLIIRLQLDAVTPIAKNSNAVVASQVSIAEGGAVHGAELRKAGYTLEEVVRDYGDLCQSITELAFQKQLNIPTKDFQTLNACLDEAIADAVASFARARDAAIIDAAEELHDSLDDFIREQKQLVSVAVESFEAIKAGNMGLSGATGTLLRYTLEQLRLLPEQRIPHIRLTSAASTVDSSIRTPKVA